MTSEADEGSYATTFNLVALGTYDGDGDGDAGEQANERSAGAGAADADAVFYVKLSDMLSVFKFRTPRRNGWKSQYSDI